MNQERFNPLPKHTHKKLNVLPPNPEEASASSACGPGRFPSWLHRKLPKGNALFETGKVLSEKRLHTVCEEAKCPNLLECWSKKTATFLVLGKACTRSCGFCDIDFTLDPKHPEEDEPERVAHSVQLLGLKHVVITMVARDDLRDGGASHLKKIVDTIRASSPSTTIELLTSDLAANPEALNTIVSCNPEVFNHNIETVRSLTPRVRHVANYDRTLKVLDYMRKNGAPELLVKSGLMVGLGEKQDEVFQTLKDLKNVGCDAVTIGQYLQANRNKLRVKAFIHPDEFEVYANFGRSIGISKMFCGPFVRSSYHAGEIF